MNCKQACHRQKYYTDHEKDKLTLAPRFCPIIEFLKYIPHSFYPTTLILIVKSYIHSALTFLYCLILRHLLLFLSRHGGFYKVLNYSNGLDSHRTKFLITIRKTYSEN